MMPLKEISNAPEHPQGPERSDSKEASAPLSSPGCLISLDPGIGSLSPFICQQLSPSCRTHSDNSCSARGGGGGWGVSEGKEAEELGDLG